MVGKAHAVSVEPLSFVANLGQFSWEVVPPEAPVWLWLASCLHGRVRRALPQASEHRVPLLGISVLAVLILWRWRWLVSWCWKATQVTANRLQ